MPAEHDPPKVDTLVRVGNRVLNVAFLILAERGEHQVIDVTLLSGARVWINGPEAEDLWKRLVSFVPDPAAGTGSASPTVVTRRKRVDKDSSVR